MAVCVTERERAVSVRACHVSVGVYRRAHVREVERGVAVRYEINQAGGMRGQWEKGG